MHKFIVEEKDVNNLVSKTYICTKNAIKLILLNKVTNVTMDQPCKKIHFIDHL